MWCPPDPLAGREEARTGPHTPASSGRGVGGIQVMVSRINSWTPHRSLQSTLTVCAVIIYYVAEYSFCHVQFYFQNVKVNIAWFTSTRDLMFWQCKNVLIAHCWFFSLESPVLLPTLFLFLHLLSYDERRIHGGEDATEGEFPYIISIRRIANAFKHM